MLPGMSYLGSKSGSGVYQAIINLMPPHDTYIELFLGSGAVMKKKPPALNNIGVDLNRTAIDTFDYASAQLLNIDAFEFLQTFDFISHPKTLIYADPPYLLSTRTSKARYEHELTQQQHLELLSLLLNLDCFIILSAYRNDLYDDLLSKWFSMDFQSMTRGGVRTETVYCNFHPSKVHYHTYAGKDFTDRQRIKRKAERWANKFSKLDHGERQAILTALLQVDLS